MSIADNKAVVLNFLKAVKDRDEAALDAVLAEDGAYWVLGMGEFPKAKFVKLIRSLWDAIEGPVRIDVEIMTGEEDRVSIIGQGVMATKAGGRYDNNYHMLAFVRDGRIYRWREYFNVQISAQALGFKAG